MAVVSPNALPSGDKPVDQLASDVAGRRHAVPWSVPDDSYRQVDGDTTPIGTGAPPVVVATTEPSGDSFPATSIALTV